MDVNLTFRHENAALIDSTVSLSLGLKLLWLTVSAAEKEKTFCAILLQYNIAMLIDPRCLKVTCSILFQRMVRSWLRSMVCLLANQCISSGKLTRMRAGIGLYANLSLASFEYFLNSYRFEINLMSGDHIESSDIALRLNSSFVDKKIIRSTIINNASGEEEKDGGFPFTKGSYFSFKITCNPSHFAVS